MRTFAPAVLVIFALALASRGLVEPGLTPGPKPWRRFAAL